MKHFPGWQVIMPARGRSRAKPSRQQLAFFCLKYSWNCSVKPCCEIIVSSYWDWCIAPLFLHDRGPFVQKIQTLYCEGSNTGHLWSEWMRWSADTIAICWCRSWWLFRGLLYSQTRVSGIRIVRILQSYEKSITNWLGSMMADSPGQNTV